MSIELNSVGFKPYAIQKYQYSYVTINMKKEDCYVRLEISTYNKEQVDILSTIIGFEGNISDDQGWIHVEMEKPEMLFGEICDKFIDIIETNVDELKQLDFYDGANLFVEYFSEDYLSTEFGPDILSKLGKLGINLCINQILMYPSKPRKELRQRLA